MSRQDLPAPVDREALIERVYALQVDLKILEGYLARSTGPELSHNALLDLDCLHLYLQAHVPGVARH